MAGKTIRIEPKRSYHFWWYVIGVFLIPLLVGIYILYKKINELSGTFYKISERSITAVHPSYTETVDIENINEIDIHQRWIDKRFGTGILRLKTNTREVELIGIENPENLAEMILKAAEMERNRIKEQERKKSREFNKHSGNLDKLDYLTGLWQQGLITNDEFNQEKKHFEGD